MLSLRIGSLLNLVADFMHNFTDGMAIAASFMSSPAVRFLLSPFFPLHPP